MPVEDEHLLSLTHAYMRLNGQFSSRRLFGDGHRSIFVNSGFNYHYKRAAALFEHVLPVERFLDNYGLGRLDKPYCDTRLYRDRITGRWLAGPSFGGARRAGEEEVNNVSHFSFCPQCRSHDIATVSYARWRRSHQVRGVQVCPTHACRLIRSCAHCGNSPGVVTGPECDCADCAKCGAKYPVLPLEGAHADRFLLFAQFVYALLQERVPRHDVKMFISFLETRAMERFGVSERAVPARIRRELEKTFGRDFLDDLGLNARDGGRAGWIRWFFARLGYTQDWAAYALIGAVVFRSIEEWIDAYAQVSRTPSVVRTAWRGVYHPVYTKVIRLDARILKDLAWQSDLNSLEYYEETLVSVIANVPGLENVRNTRLIRAKQELLPQKQSVLHALFETRSKRVVQSKLYKMERRTMGRGWKIAQATLNAIAYRWYLLHGDQDPMPAKYRIWLYGKQAEKVIAKTHADNSDHGWQPRNCAAALVDAM